jgi:hypothetical protein
MADPAGADRAQPSYRRARGDSGKPDSSLQAVQQLAATVIIEAQKMEIKVEFFKKDPGNKKFGYRKWHSPIGKKLSHVDYYNWARIYETHWLFTLPFFEVRFTALPYFCM